MHPLIFFTKLFLPYKIKINHLRKVNDRTLVRVSELKVHYPTEYDAEIQLY